ncbi:TldD/PmbA family protein [Proteinivorax tanatarense]|uniref:TldD/PmbA family protein n=1 Tax=Proteinivorax tanatarense TaxID=1260629 RepID=A0AAU7VPB8_9FIRM
MKKLLSKALEVAEQAEVYVREISSNSVNIKLDELKEVNSKKKTEISLRIVKDGNMGTAVATSLDDETIIDRAVIALKNQKSEAIVFPNKENAADVISWSEEIKNMDTKKLTDFAFEQSKRLKDAADDINFGVNATRSYRKVHILNSSGFDKCYEYTNLSLSLSTITDKGFAGASKEFSTGKIPQVNTEDIQDLIKMHRLSSNPITLDNEKMPVIFTGKVMGSLMLRVLGGVNGGNVVKDISPLKNKVGQQLFSKNITIRDDGKMPFGVNTCLFDDEGTPSQNTMLYDKGVLKNYLVGISQSKKLDKDPTGNAFKRTLFSKEIEDKPAVFDTNIVIEGNHKDDKEIIKGIKRGLFITGVMGAHTGNINQGEFSMNISSGYLIEDGKLVGQVKGSMIAGNIYDLFKNIEAVGTKYEVMRSIFYHMGYSPMVCFSSANIVGK